MMTLLRNLFRKPREERSEARSEQRMARRRYVNPRQLHEQEKAWWVVAVEYDGNSATVIVGRWLGRESGLWGEERYQYTADELPEARVAKKYAPPSGLLSDRRGGNGDA